MIRVVIFALVAAMVAPLAASAQVKPVEINVILSLTGPTAFVGNTELQGLQVFESFLNKKGGIRGRPVKFALVDDTSNPVTAVQLANGLMAKNPNVILGPNIAGTCAAVAAVITDKGPVQYCFSPATDPPVGGFAFDSSATLATTMTGQYHRLALLGFKRLAILYSTDATGQAVEKATAKAFEKSGSTGKLVLIATEHYNPADISVSAQIARLKAQRPDVLYLGAFGNGFATALREVSNSGLDIPVVVAPTNVSPEQVASYATFLPKSMITLGMPYQTNAATTQQRTVNNEFKHTFEAAGIEPNLLHGYAWDVATIVTTALRAVGPDASPAQVRDYILGMRGFYGSLGPYDFPLLKDQHGLTDDSVVLVRWDHAKKTWLAI